MALAGFGYELRLRVFYAAVSDELELERLGNPGAG